MSFEKHLERKGVRIQEDNSLPPGERTQRNVKRVIAAIRAAEAEFNTDLRDAERRCREAQDRVVMLTAELQRVKAELLKHQMRDRLCEDDYEKLTTAEKRRLLEVVN